MSEKESSKKNFPVNSNVQLQFRDFNESQELENFEYALIDPDISLEELRDTENLHIIGFPQLFHTTLTNKLYEWQIFWDLEQMHFYTIFGHVGGKLQKSTVVDVVALKKKTDLLDIGLTRIKKKFKDQVTVKLYSRNQFPTQEVAIIGKRERCMLAQKLALPEEIEREEKNNQNSAIRQYFDEGKIKKGTRMLFDVLCRRGLITQDQEINVRNYPLYLKKIKDFKLKLSFPVFTQIKIDGVRTLVHRNPLTGKPQYLSRQNKEYVFIGEYLDEEISKFIYYLSKYSDQPELDGEMWAPGYSFNVLTGIIQRSVNESTDLQNVKYNIFDYFNSEELPYQTRYKNLIMAYNDYVEVEGEPLKFDIVECQAVKSYLGIKRQHQKYVLAGHEGTIIRKISSDLQGEEDPKKLSSSKYIHGRTSNILKITDWFSAEGTIVDIIAGEGKYHDQGIMVLENPFYDDCISKSRKTFKVTPEANEEQKREYLINKENYIGKPYTFEYKALTAYKCPFKCRGKGVRDYE